MDDLPPQAVGNSGAARKSEESTSDPGGQNGSAVVVSNIVLPPATQDIEDSQKLKDSTPRESLFSRINLLIATLTLIVIILVVVLVVLLNKNDTSSQKASDSLSTTPALTPSQTEDDGACVDAVCSFLIGILKPFHPEGTWENILKGGTCQNSALQWLS